MTIILQSCQIISLRYLRGANLPSARKKGIRVSKKQRRWIIVVLCVVAIVGFVLFEMIRINILP